MSTQTNETTDSTGQRVPAESAWGQAVDGREAFGLVPDGQPAATTGASADALVDGPWLDALLARVDEQGLQLTGEGGFLPALVKAVLERGLAAELTDHLGYERGDPAGRGGPNSRNGTTPKTPQTEVGPVGLDTPRDRDASFEPRLVPKGSRRLGGGLDDAPAPQRRNAARRPTNAPPPPGSSKAPSSRAGNRSSTPSPSHTPADSPNT